jgi:hypothetical protein
MWQFENACQSSNYQISKNLNNVKQPFSNLQIGTFSNCSVGKDGFEPPNSEEDRFTVCCRWPLGYLPGFTIQSHLSESNQRPTDYKSVALPAELKWHFQTHHSAQADTAVMARVCYATTAGIAIKNYPKILGRQR